MLKSDSDMKPALESSTLGTIRNAIESDKKKKPWCDHCKKHWHTQDTYWKIHRKPPNWKKKNTTRQPSFPSNRRGARVARHFRNASFHEGIVRALVQISPISIVPSHESIKSLLLFCTNRQLSTYQYQVPTNSLLDY
ncbi:hypothetical protein ACH5RR_040713 [Cinchona calisaya]|uniref:Uncharacterized protein n=1 Tax=Cinchona calisaya TaxID=153742 RepID=A0ABD2XU54_9GENT